MPISPIYLMEQFDIPNPEKMVKDFWEYKLEEAQKMTEIQIAAMAMSPMGMLGGAMQQGLFGGGQSGAGRPPSGNEPPHVESKDGGTRTTIAES
jgi:hypothetical protein